MGQGIVDVGRRALLAGIIGAPVATAAPPGRFARAGYVWVETPVEAWAGLVEASRVLRDIEYARKAKP